MIITEVKSCLDLVENATNFANKLQDGWYRGSAEVDSFKAQVVILREQHDQWSAQLRRHGVSEDERLLRAVQAAAQVLLEQEQYLSRLQKKFSLLRLRRKAFPGKLTYVLKNVSDIVGAGPQLQAARLATFDMLERIGAQTPAPLPFIPDPNYVPISESILEIREALEVEQGPRVVTVFGGPGLGKSSVVKYLALQYEEERKQGLQQSQRRPLSCFPDGVYYLFCGKDAKHRVKQLQGELVEYLGFGPGSSAPPNDQTGNGMQEGSEAYPQQPSHQLKLRSRLAEQKLLIILDDIWEREVLQQLLVAAMGVKYLVTSQLKEIWGPAAKIQMRCPTDLEARQIMSNYTDGLPIKGNFPAHIQLVTDAIMRTVGYHPLSLANVGISVNSRRATDESHWKAIEDNIHVLLHEEDDLQVSPVMFETSYDLSIGASMMLMVESLRPDARRLLFLIALLEGEHLPETLVRYFYKWIQPAQSTDFRRNYENHEKYLADRSLVDLQMQGNESMWESMPYMRNKRTLAGHRLRMYFIRKKNTVDVSSIAAQILERSNQGGTHLTEEGDAEARLATILGAIYFKRPFKYIVANSLKKHLRILDDGIIPRNISTGVDDQHDLVLHTTRSEIRDLVWLLNVNHDGDLGAWQQQAHGYAKKIIIKLACQGILDDYSMASLLKLPQTTSAACEVLIRCCPTSLSYDENETFSREHSETMNTLLALLHDNGVSTTRRAAVIQALKLLLDYESKATILNVAAKYMEFLAIDFSDSILQRTVVWSLGRTRFGRSDDTATRAEILMGEFTGILDLLLALLVSGKDYKVQISAGEALHWFCQWKCSALKVAAIPHALEKLFNLFLAGEIHLIGEALRQVTLASIDYDIDDFGVRRAPPSYLAGHILGDLSCVEENRIKFSSLEIAGLGNILARLEGTWRTSHKYDRGQLEQRASRAAGILDQLALDKELRHSIASLPGLEEGLLFLQLIEIKDCTSSRIRRYTSSHIRRMNSARALTKLCHASTNPRLRGIPTLKQIQEISSCDDCLAAMGGEAYLSIYWNRAQAHTEMGAYKEALENLDLAQCHLDQLTRPDEISVEISPGCFRGATETWRHTRMFLQAMLGDHTGALSWPYDQLEFVFDDDFDTVTLLTQRGILKRLCRDLQGAHDDLNAANAAHQLILNPRDYFHWFHRPRPYHILKHLGYVKYLMKDEVGARADAEFAQQLQLKSTLPDIEGVRHSSCLWNLKNLPVNYLGYFSSPYVG